MRRWGRLAIPILLVALIVSAQPASAINTTTVVGSNHTTANDFNAATTLDNVGVENTGKAANVVLQTGPEIDDFEDGDIAGWSGDTGAFSNVGQTESGATMGLGSRFSKLDKSSSANVQVTRSVSSSSYYAFYFMLEDSNNAQYYHFRALDGATRIISVTAEFDGSGEIIANGQATGVASNNGVEYFVEIKNVDFQSETFDVYIDNSLVLSGVSFENSASSVDTLEISYTGGGSGAQGYTDHILGDPETTGTYISANHSVERAVEGFTDLTLSDADAVVTWQYYDGAWTDAASQTFSTSGNKTIDISGHADQTKWRVNVTFINQSVSGPATAELHSEGVRFENAQPQVNNATASPTGEVSKPTQTLSIDINDSTFTTIQGDTATVTFRVNGTVVGTDTLIANGTATTQTTQSRTYGWTATVADAYGSTNTSSTFVVRAPRSLVVRNVSNVSEKITNTGDARVKIFGSEGTLVERKIIDGEISLSGISRSEELVVVVNVDGFHQRSTLLNSAFEQRSIFLLNDTTSRFPSRETQFVVDDKTGNFEPIENTSLVVQRSLNTSNYSELPNNGIKWVTVGGDRLGADASFILDLEHQARYRLIIDNNRGRTRVLGEYTAEEATTVTLTIQQIDIEVQNITADVLSGLERRKNPERLVFQYNDTKSLTTDLRVMIYERGNRTNEIYNQSHPGPHGELVVSASLTSNQVNKSWVVEFRGDRDGSEITGKLQAGTRGEPGLPIDGIWLEAGAVFAILLAPTLAGGARAETGAVFATMVGGIAWWLQLLPAEIGGGAVAFAMAIAVALKLRERNGQVA